MILQVLEFKSFARLKMWKQKFPNPKVQLLVVINSVCGCAAGQCRPGVAQALQADVTPDHLFTVFAGQDKEATAKAREYFAPYPPSSPSIALMKDGELVHFIERHQIENRSAAELRQISLLRSIEFCH